MIDLISEAEKKVLINKRVQNKHITPKEAKENVEEEYEVEELDKKTYSKKVNTQLI